MSVVISGYTIDASVNENHESASDVTQLEVEKGSDITDHIRPTPDRLSITGVVTDTPIGAIADQRSSGALPSEEALALLYQIEKDAEPITVETDLRIYTNMALTRLSVPVSKDTGKALRFTAEFQEIRIITNARTTVRAAVPRGRRKQNRGVKPPTPFQRVLLGGIATIAAVERDIITGNIDKVFNGVNSVVVRKNGAPPKANNYFDTFKAAGVL